MVLWEIALGTAYFLGLKRTYKLALRAQRKVISPNHPKVRGIVQGRIRYVFDMALTVHRKIQGRDLDVSRNVGNWILRCLDKARPSAQIRPPHLPPPGVNTNTTIITKANQVNKTMDKDSGRRLFTASRGFWPKSFPAIANFMKPMRRALPSSDVNASATNMTKQFNNQGNNIGKKWDRESRKRLFTAARSFWPKPLSAINTFLKPMRSNVQSRPYSSSGVQHFTVNYGKFRSGDVVRNDIRQWILRN